MRTRRRQYSSPEPPSLFIDPKDTTSVVTNESPVRSPKNEVVATPEQLPSTTPDTSSGSLVAAIRNVHVDKKPRLMSEPTEVLTLKNGPDSQTLLVSVASLDPNLRLMGMALEIRERILRYILARQPAIIVSFTRKAAYDHGWPAVDFAAPGLTLGGKHTTAILRVCKQIHLEAAMILYGANHFISFHVRAFAGRFIGDRGRGIGLMNARLIRKATFGVPIPAKTGRDDTSICQLVDVLSKILSGLQELELTVKDAIMWDHQSVSRAPHARELLFTERRGLLNATAWATHHHPTLKKAIWKSGGGGSVISSAPGRLAFVVHYTVLMVPVRKDELSDNVETTVDEYGKSSKTKVRIS